MSTRFVTAACGVALFALALPVSAQRGPAPVPTRLPADVLALACAPVLAYEPPMMPLRVTGGQDSFARRSYAPGDLVTINAGTRNGIEVGQEYYVRRLQASKHQTVTRDSPAGIGTMGWIKVYAVDETMSLATVTHACDTIDVGDYLEPFALPQVPAVSTNRAKPERDNYARVLVGADRRMTFGTGEFFTIDRGADFGITPGSTFVLYRDKGPKAPQNFLYDLGEAVAVDVKASSATLRLTVARDAVHAGDYVAMRRAPVEN